MPRWLVVTDLYRTPVSVTSLAAGADLRAALRAAMVGYAADGWQVERDGAYDFVFVNSRVGRRMLNVTSVHPGAGHAYLAGRRAPYQGSSEQIV
jgi:hypothetical protein